ncbi:hypothetical protein MCOR02_002276 [Pyricularia oryzae]|nr:hypothetical protein MCOR02_002276 [Pyricularia oryzae]KAI6326321.1 hypothetical protein MCOR34_000858 [Pyricularia oryzae]KAI6471870.1 hypothetical protein MCOR17_003044 [Pyricularia oryzae]KAI6493974.1 hypothetical protein MCOR13_007654 [Pyricularia oryzae]KAI6605176.1 hypothetical protein MCOR04_001227 [Pyricularia oryzae]
MASNEPKLLYAIDGISAYHITNGSEETLTPAGPQTLSLLMVPTSSPFADRSVDPKSGKSEEDFYLHLHLPPELDLPLPATTQIYHQPPRSYLIPRWDLGRDSGAFTRIEFPELGSRRHIQENVDTFETILAQCTAFLERAPPPKLGVSSSSKGEKSGFGDEKAAARSMETGVAGPSSSKSKAALAQEPPPYNPNDFQPGEAYARGSHSKQQTGQIVLIDEEDGSVIGELGEGMTVIEHQALQPGSKEPVEITLPTDSTQNISVAPASKESVEMLMHPAYQKSFLVSNASMASRFIVGTSDKVSSMLQSGATAITAKSKPASKPMTFKPATHERIRRINTFTGGAVGLSTKTVGQIGKVAQNVGATLARKGHKGGGKGFDKDGNPIDGYKPGLLNKSLMAFSTVADGIEQAGKTLLTSTSNAATTVVEHKWGPEAGDVSRNLGSGVKNVGLVYIDVTGVSRRALVKNVAKGMIVGKAPNGKDVIVGGGDGGVVPVPPEKRLKDSEGNGTSSSASSIKGYSDDKKAAIEYK